MIFAKIENDNLKYPTASEFVGIPNFLTHETVLRRKGYMPLEGTAEEHEGYEAIPSSWHIVPQSITKIEPRREDPVTHEPFMEDIMEEDPETHEMKKTGERQVTRDTEVVFDKSYIQIDEWEYEKLPDPVPEPDPVIRYSKYKIQLACQKRNLWEQVKTAIINAGLQDSWGNIVDISSDNPELQAALPKIKETFGEELTEEVLAESVAD